LSSPNLPHLPLLWARLPWLHELCALASPHIVRIKPWWARVWPDLVVGCLIPWQPTSNVADGLPAGRERVFLDPTER
jgi:hypothetical protein